MNYEDRITKEYVENAIGDGLRLITGTYVGDGEETQYIHLGVTPKALGVWKDGCIQYVDGYYLGGVVFPGYSLNGLALSGTGFRVALNGTKQTNCQGCIYVYVALY